jgi:hypothetical protein
MRSVRASSIDASIEAAVGEKSGQEARSGVSGAKIRHAAASLNEAAIMDDRKDS